MPNPYTRLGKRQKEILKWMLRGFLIKECIDLRDMSESRVLEDEEGADTLMDVSKQTIQSFCGRGLLNVYNVNHCLELQHTNFRLKEEYKEPIRLVVCDEEEVAWHRMNKDGIIDKLNNLKTVSHATN